MLSEGGEENSIYHAFAAPFKRAGTERGTSSIIKSGQKGTEASIPGNIFQHQIPDILGFFKNIDLNNS